MAFVNIGPGISYSKRSAALIEIDRKKVEPDAIRNNSYGGDEWARWGTNNKLPLELLDQVKKDPVSQRALGFKVDAHYGLGPQLYKKKYEKVKGIIREVIEPQDISEFPEIDDFFFENAIENFSQSIIQDYEWFNRYHVEYISNKAENKIVRMNSGIEEEGGVNYLRTKDIRKKKRNRNTGRMEGFYVSGDWTEGTPKTAFIPSFNPRDPFRYKKAMYEHKLVSISNDYYPTPRWYSALTWLAVAAKIPRWILSNIENSTNIKYHIHIPEEYFINLYPEDKFDSIEACYKAREEAEENLKTKMDDFLAGEENVHKNFYSKFALDQEGNPIPGWKIEMVPNDLKDGAWLNADQTATVRILTAHGVDPSLAGVIISSTSAGSGSDVLNKFNYHMQLNTVIPRQTTTEWFEVVKRANDWDRQLHLGYKNIILNKMDENKSGFHQENEPTPTTQEK
ncbi:MAG: hypothetical protein AAF363_18695 [Bacteroidota bacterium]